MLLAALVTLVFAASDAWTQTDRRDWTDDTPEVPKAKAEAEAETQLLPRMAPIVQAGPVDPQRYVLGPGDVLQLDLWGRLSRSVLLVVDPEGSVFLPGAGSLSVTGHTLAWSREQILRKVSQSFRGVVADVRLTQLRTFKVYLSGFVSHPGAVDVTSAARASEALQNAGLQPESSHRNIQILRRGGSVVRVDLSLFEALGDQNLNPTLVDGDVIVVPRATEFVQVLGPVGRPGSFELAPGDSLHTILALSGGVLPSAVLDRVLMVRFTSASERESLWINLADAGSGTNDIALRDGDHLFLVHQPEYHLLPKVGIFGEIQQPGNYPIRVGQDRLTDLVRWAGGFRPLANQSAVLLLRGVGGSQQNDPEFDRLIRLARSEMTESEYAKFQTKLAERKNSFRIDWTRLQEESNETDPLLLDGDVIRVDPLVPTVRVEGEVRRPGYVDYHPGRSLRDYVELSGGYTDRASKAGVRVSRSLTGQVIPARSLRSVQPGDFIWVPERRDVDAWGVFRDVVTVAGQLAVIIFTLTR